MQVLILFNRAYWNFSDIIDATTEKMKRSARSLFSTTCRGVSPRHPVHMDEQASASSCAGAIACRRAGGCRGWRGWTSSAVLACTASGLSVIGRRDAATTPRSRFRNAKARPRSAATRGRGSFEVSLGGIFVLRIWLAKIASERFLEGDAHLEAGQFADPHRGRSRRRVEIGGRLISRRHRSRAKMILVIVDRRT